MGGSFGLYVGECFRRGPVIFRYKMLFDRYYAVPALAYFSVPMYRVITNANRRPKSDNI